MSAWQPIETVPKDGTPVLLCIAGEDYYPRSAWWDVGYGKWVVALSLDGRHSFLALEPTHWMPLPEPPEQG